MSWADRTPPEMESVETVDLAAWQSAAEEVQEGDYFDFGLDEFRASDEAASSPAIQPVSGAADSLRDAAPQRVPPAEALLDYDHQAALAGALT